MHDVHKKNNIPNFPLLITKSMVISKVSNPPNNYCKYVTKKKYGWSKLCISFLWLCPISKSV